MPSVIVLKKLHAPALCRASDDHTGLCVHLIGTIERFQDLTDVVTVDLLDMPPESLPLGTDWLCRFNGQVELFLGGPTGLAAAPVWSFESDGFLAHLGEVAYASLLDVPEAVDLALIFRRSESVPPFVEEAIQISAKAVWMQLGIVNVEAAQAAKEAGLKVVMNACLMVEHRRI